MATAAVFASAAYAAPAFEAGTYQAKAPGMHGDVVVETTFAKDRIEAVKVVKQAETQGIGTKAVEVLPGRIVEAQSPNVDGVSGATLTSNEDLIITASVPEKFIGSLRPGMSALFESVAYPGRMYEGTLSYISPNLNRQSRSADIKIDITGSTEGLMDGMYIKLNLETEHIDNAMIVPSAALDTYLGNDVVYVVEDGAAVRKTVETGSSNDTETVILSGLDEGELVITAGNVTNGTPVNVV